MLEVLKLFRIVLKSIRSHYQNVERQAGISGAQLWALAHVADNPGITVGNLSSALAIHQSTASNLIRDLGASGFLTRRRLREDQRTVRLFATGKGLRVLRRAPRPLIGVLQQALASLPAGNLDRLHLQLGILIASMKSKDIGARSIPLSDI